MAFPTVTVEVALTTDPGDTPSWTNISARLMGFTVRRGRDQELSRFSAGHATIILANDDRRFDPTYAAGIYYPNVLPMRRVRIRAVYAAVTYDIFNGYADGWDQTYEPPQVATCTLTATDAFKVLASISLPTSAYATEVVADEPVHWWRMGDAVGSTTATDSGSAPIVAVHDDQGSAALPVFGQAGLVSREPGTSVLMAENQQFALPASASIGATNLTFSVEAIVKPVSGGLFTTTSTRVYLQEGAGGDISLSIKSASAGGTFSWAGLDSTTTWSVSDGVGGGTDPGLTYHLVGTYDNGNVELYVNGVLEASGVTATVPAATPFYIAGARPSGADTYYQDIAVYHTALSAARIAEHAAQVATPWTGDTAGARINRILDAAGWPAADRDIDTGVAVLQSADLNTTALAALQKVEETEQGLLFVTAAGLVRFVDRSALIQAPYTTVQATFGDSGAELEYADLSYRYDDQTIVNEVRVSRRDGAMVVASDTASQATYLRRTRIVDGLLHQDDSTSTDLGNWILGKYKDALMRATGVHLEPAAGNETTHYPQVLGRELGERVNVKRRPQCLGAAIDQDAAIEGITHRVTGRQTWDSTWNLSPADTQTYGVWDDPDALWDIARWSF